MQERYGIETATKLGVEFRNELEILLNRMPRLDEDASSIWERQLGLTTMFLAIYKVLKKRGYGPDHAWETCIITYGSFLGALPSFVKKRMKKSGFNKKIKLTYLNDQNMLARKKVAEGDVFTFIDGVGEDFDFGMDIHECAKVKFLEKENALEFMPYVCLVDIIINEAMGVGITRSKTIADGDGVCNFRLKENGSVKITSPVLKEEWDVYSEIWT